MTHQEVRTLAYPKSPKASKRTTFQVSEVVCLSDQSEAKFVYH